ncbi:MAG: efflux RND transporter permease subunit, partial [Salinivirgaceae bacterium]|nr:efflux RND transporter permease subunit [Salinivirgaceae bacterium]
MEMSRDIKEKISFGGFSAFSIIVIFVLLSIVGLGLVSKLDIRLLPSKNLPKIYVSYSWYGTSARIIENRVTSELEGMISSLKGVKEVRSVSSQNHGVITVDFEKSINLDIARFYVASIIRQTFPRFPAGVSYPQIELSQASERGQALLGYSLYGNLTPEQLYQYAEHVIKPSLTNIKGVSAIDFYGLNSIHFFIVVDENLEQRYNLSIDDFSLVIQNYFTTLNLGVAQFSNDKEFS